MKGYYYIFAMSALIGIATAISDLYIILLVYLLWLIYLYIFSHVEKKVIIISLSTFFLFFYNYLHDDYIDDSELQGEQFIGDIVSPLHITDKKYEFTFYDTKNNINMLSVLYIDEQLLSEKDKLAQLQYGASCELKGTLKKPTTATNPGQFDYENYLNKKGLTYELIIQSVEDIGCQNHKWLHFVYQFRLTMIEKVNESLSKETAQWLNALIFGNSSFIDSETIKLFQQWGLSHILAISGLHTGIIVGIIYFLLVKLLITTKEKANLLLMMFLPFFALITGGEPSVWRASLMVLLFLLLNRFKLDYELLDIFSIVFITLLIVDPTLIFHIGFQFSFLVTFGLLLSVQLLKKTNSRFYQALLISFVAQMIILPLQLHYFYTFQPLSIILNVIVIPYFSLFVIPLMFLILFMLFLPASLLKVVDHMFTYVNDLFLFFLNVVNDHFNYPLLAGDISVTYFVIYYIFFYLMMYYLEQNKLKRSFSVSIILICLLCSLALRPYFSPVGTVTMLDIGQGDAFIVELPYRKGVFLIDIGSTVSFPDFEPTQFVYDSIIQSYLNKQSIYSIDAIFLTHEHADHYGSLPYLIEDKKVSKIIVSEYFEWPNQLYNVLKRYDVHIEEVRAKGKLTLNGHDFYLLSPELDMKSANNNSLVIYTQFGANNWLFTGDIEKESENLLVNDIKNLPVDVLKVAHHGSNTSTQDEFINNLNVKYALISVGKNNMYGHPTDDVLARLNDKNIEVFRTDYDGAVQYFYDDNRAVFKRFNGRK